jgi:hypothetical protein
MAIKLNSPDWQIRIATTRGGGPAAAALPDLPPAFLTSQSSIEVTFVAQPRPQVRAAGGSPGALDFSCDVGPGEAAVVAVRHPSGALTFHPPADTTRFTRGGPAVARFVVPIRPVPSSASQRGIATSAVKAMVVKVSKKALDAVVGVAMRTLAEKVERALWTKRKLTEGWLKVERATLAAGQLAPGRPTSTARSLLFVHGTFSNAASAYRALAASDFLDQVAPLYGDRIFAFDHFSISRTPEENARMLLEGLPNKRFQFDVIAHSRGGLVVRNLVERGASLGPLASRFTLGQAVLVGVPNEGTPIATPRRWEDTIGWVANLLELFPDNPFTSGAELVANGIVWMAARVSGDLPGLHAMDGDAAPIRELQ